MKDKKYANDLRKAANSFEQCAQSGYKLAVNKTHPKNMRIIAARHYRSNIKLAQEFRERTKKYE